MSDYTLSERMQHYESQYAAQKLIPFNPICARMDGRAFRTFKQGLCRPFDQRFCRLMIQTTKYLVKEMEATVGYCFDDEISLVWINSDRYKLAVFNYNTVKLTSILASMTTAYFNKKLWEFIPENANSIPIFDARIWNVPTLDEAGLYLLWRETDSIRNSISKAADFHYSPNDTFGLSNTQKKDILLAKGVNWDDYPDHFKRGTYIHCKEVVSSFSAEDVDSMPLNHHFHQNNDLKVTRRESQVVELPFMSKLENRTECLFFGEAPKIKQTGS